MGYELLELSGKVAVVVGGTSGIGRAIGHGLAEAGADVVPTSRRLDQVEAAASEIEQRGRRTIRVTSDVSDRASLERLLSESIAAFGKVDILINSAGRTKRAPTLDFLEEDWNAIIDTNLSGTLRSCQVFGRHMLERGYGRIVNIASDAARLGTPRESVYAGAKAAVIGFSKSLAAEVARHGIAVNVVSPSTTDTPLVRSILSEEQIERRRRANPSGRLGRPEDVAEAVLFFVCGSGYVTGQVLSVNGGSARPG